MATILTLYFGVYAFMSHSGRAMSGAYAEPIYFLRYRSTEVTAESPPEAPDRQSPPEAPDGSGSHSADVNLAADLSTLTLTLAEVLF